MPSTPGWDWGKGEPLLGLPVTGYLTSDQVEHLPLVSPGPAPGQGWCEPTPGTGLEFWGKSTEVQDPSCSSAALGRSEPKSREDLRTWVSPVGLSDLFCMCQSMGRCAFCSCSFRVVFFVFWGFFINKACWPLFSSVVWKILNVAKFKELGKGVVDIYI